MLGLAERFAIREVRYDPYQMQAVAQRLAAARVPMVEFPQTAGNLTAASTGLYELAKGRNLIVYLDDALRLAVQRAVAVETSRGWRIAKERASHKIDVVVALAMASYGAIQACMGPPSLMNAVDLLDEQGRPVPVPRRCHLVFAVVVASADGRAGVMYFGSSHYGRRPDMTRAALIDFDELSVAGVGARAVGRLRELAKRAARGLRCCMPPA